MNHGTLTHAITWIAVVLASMVGNTGCKNGDSGREGSPPTGASASPSVASMPSAADTADEDDEYPVPEDYAEEAVKEIREDNLNAELKKLESEITSGP